MPNPDSRHAGKTYLSARQVRRRYGDVSDTALWRWLQDAELRFPQPRYINRCRYWDEAELDTFDDRRSAKPARQRPTEAHTSA